MNKTVVTVAFFILAMLCILGAMAVLIFAPNLIEQFVSTIVTILGIATSAAVMFYGLGKQGEQIQEQAVKLDTIQTQTNGNTTALLNENKRLTNLLARTGAISLEEVSASSGQHSAAE